MRYLPIDSVSDGMILGTDILNEKGFFLLSKNTKLTIQNINKLKSIGYTGIYIKDNISKNIYTEEIIGQEIRIRIANKVREIVLNIEENKIFSKDNEKLFRAIDELINKIISNKNVVINLLDLKIFDDYTYFHSVNVAIISIIIGYHLQLNKEEMYKLGLAALMHDIGKTFVSQKVLNKPEKLTKDEFEEVKIHSEKGYEFLKEKMPFPFKTYREVLDGVLNHHEQYDGSGYPQRLRGNNISLFGRIICISDVYDALTSSRVYRPAMLPSEAIEYIMGNSGKMFDPQIVKVFLKKILPYPIGTGVKLSDGNIGIVIKNHEDCCLRPVVKIFKNEKISYVIDLKNDTRYWTLTIVGLSDLSEIKKVSY